MLNQLTVFMQNTEGRLAQMCRVLADANINMHSLFIADTVDFGVARVFCDTPRAARKALNAAGFRVSVIPVIGVKVPNHPGGLADLVELFDKNGINIEYNYCFTISDNQAIDIIKADDTGVEQILVDAGFELVQKEEIYQRD